MLRSKQRLELKYLVEFDDCRTGAPENFQENPLLKAGYFFYRHTSEIGSFEALTNLTKTHLMIGKPYTLASVNHQETCFPTSLSSLRRYLSAQVFQIALCDLLICIEPSYAQEGTSVALRISSFPVVSVPGKPELKLLLPTELGGAKWPTRRLRGWL